MMEKDESRLDGGDDRNLSKSGLNFGAEGGLFIVGWALHLKGEIGGGEDGILE